MLNSKKSLVRSEGVAELALADVTLHPLVETHPRMEKDQYNALITSLRLSHQIEPIVLYRGKVVDGRHRCLALKELGADVVYAISLPNNTTLEEVGAFVDATETRRHQSATQLAIKAYDYWKRTKCTQLEAVAATGGSRANLQNVAKIVKHGRIDIINTLRAGGKVDISDKTTYKKYSDSLLAIIRKLSLQAYTPSAPADRVLTKEDFQRIENLAAGVSGWTVKEKKILIAKIYESMK